MNLTITHAGLYTKPEKYHQTAQRVFLILNISGLEYMKLYTPEGTLAAEVPESSLTLIPESFQLDFSFRNPRKNYTVICKIDGLSWNEQTKSSELDFNGQKIEIPLTIPVPPGRREQLQELFHRTVILSESALPADTKAAELLMFSVLAEFLEHTKGNSGQNIPEQLVQFRQTIDSDTGFENSLAEHMQKISLTPVHLRRLFLKYYKTNPAEYRARLRSSRIQQLLRDGDLSYKEIADAVGMKHVTHLNLFLKKQCGMTPAELRKNLHF